MRGIVNSDKDIITYSGKIVKQEASYAFVKRDKYGDDIFLYRDTSIVNWHEYKVGTDIKFNVAFNYRGPICVNIEL